VSGRAVVGADGALGSRLVGALGARGVTLRHPADVLDARVPEIEDADFVVNVSGPRVRPNLGWDDYLREHVGTAMAVARAMRPGSHLVHFGSASVYGTRGGVIRADAPEAPLRFPNPSYAWAKLAGELAARALCAERGVGWTVVRPAMVYGDGVSSAIDTIASLARRGVRLELKPASVKQHCCSFALLVALLERIAERGPQRRVLLACDPFVFTNGDIDAAVKKKRGGVGVAAPLPLAEAMLRSWPLFPDRDAPGALAALAFLGLDCEFDWRGTLGPLGIDAAAFRREATLDPYLEATL